MRDPGAIGFERFYRRIHPQIAEGLIGILPALVPVDRGLDARVTRPKHFQRLRYPDRFEHAVDIGGERKIAGGPFRDHHWLARIEVA